VRRSDAADRDEVLLAHMASSSSSPRFFARFPEGKDFQYWLFWSSSNIYILDS
jgi:hypothetical protein